MGSVLLGFQSAAHVNVRLNKNPCAALLIEKNISFLNWKHIYLISFHGTHYRNVSESDS